MTQIVTPNWEFATNEIVSGTISALSSFNDEHSDITLGVFGISFDYFYGDVTICLDTIDNSLLHAKRHQIQVSKQREGHFKKPDAWQTAIAYLRKDVLTSYNPHTSEFRFANLMRLHFSDWEPFFGNDDLQLSADPLGYVILVAHDAISKLVLSGIFDKMKLSSPFFMGIEIPEDVSEFLLLRILNWPAHVGPRS